MKTKYLVPPLLALVLSAASCSTGRSYHEWSSAWQLGYQDTALREDLYRVSYTGYGIAPETCFDFALLRAAEITLEKGARFFELMGENQSSVSQPYFLPGSTYTTGQIMSNGTFTATSTNYALTGAINRPTVAIMIHILPSQTETSMDASFVSKSLKKKHDLE